MISNPRTSFVVEPKEWLSERQRSVSDRVAATIVRDLSNAVNHSHSKGILHRDLKPSNVLLQPAGAPTSVSSGTVRREAFTPGEALLEEFPFTPKLTDFGISTPIRDSRLSTAPTNAGGSGTPQYMAPEQAQNKPAEFGWPTDVYGLGAILYEILTGSAPFCGNSPDTILRQVVHEAPKLPRFIRPSISADLEAICVKCLEKDPAQRYESAAELRCDLNRYLQGYPPTARAVSVPRQFVYWCRRKPSHAAILIFGLVIFLNGMAAGWWHFMTLGNALAAAKEERQRANIEASNAIVQRNLAETHAADISRHLFCLDAKSAHRALLSGNWQRAENLLRDYEADQEIRSGFVWRYLWGISHQFEQLWQEHEEGARAYCVAFTPDGTRLIAGTESGILLIWDVATRRELHRLSGHTTCINAISISSDGQKVATASCDHSTRIWNIESGNSESIVFEHDTELYSVCFSPDGKTLAVGDESGRIFLCDPELQRVISSTRTSQWRVTDIAYSADGRLIIAASGSEAFVFETTDLKLKSTLHDAGRVIHSVACLSRDGLIAWGGDSQVLHLSDPNDMSEVAQYFLPNDIWSFCFNENEQFLACGGGNRIGQIMDPGTGTLLKNLHGHTDRIMGIALSRDATSVATASFDGSIKLWPTERSGEWIRIPGVSGANKLAFAADGGLLITSGEHTVQALNVDDWTERYSVRASNFAVSPDSCGQFLATANDEKIQVHNSITGEILVVDPNTWSANPPFDIGVSADGRHVFGSFGTHLASSNTTGVGDRRTLASDNAGRFTSLAPHPDEATVFFANSHESRRVCSASFEGPDEVCLFGEMGGIARQLTVDRSGQFIAAASEDHFVHLWDQERKQHLAALSEHRCAVSCTAFSADSKLLVSGDESGIVCIWNIAAGHTALVLEAHDGPVAAVAFSPDGSTLATASAYKPDGTGEIKIWVAPRF